MNFSFHHLKSILALIVVSSILSTYAATESRGLNDTSILNADVLSDRNGGKKGGSNALAQKLQMTSTRLRNSPSPTCPKTLSKNPIPVISPTSGARNAPSKVPALYKSPSSLASMQSTKPIPTRKRPTTGMTSSSKKSMSSGKNMRTTSSPIMTSFSPVIASKNSPITVPLVTHPILKLFPQEAKTVAPIPPPARPQLLQTPIPVPFRLPPHSSPPPTFIVVLTPSSQIPQSLPTTIPTKLTLGPELPSTPSPTIPTSDASSIIPSNLLLPTNSSRPTTISPELIKSPSLSTPLSVPNLTSASQLPSSFSGLPTVFSRAPALSPIEISNSSSISPLMVPTDKPSLNIFSTSFPTINRVRLNQILTCISIIDESTGSQTEEGIQALWDRFRKAYPERRFCLLQPLPNKKEELFIPASFSNDPYTIYSSVSRDKGDTNNRTDWFDICNLEGLRAIGIPEVSIFIDNSGSLKTEYVKASLDLLLSRLDQVGLQLVTGIENKREDWISPFLTNFTGSNRTYFNTSTNTLRL